MKQKLSAVDIRALVILLRRKLLGLRVANIYDVSGRLYLLKLSRANRKEHLLIESGIRVHTTQYIKNQKDLPSGFSMKLRKHLRTKKLENITQLGIDRVIDLTFGRGEAAYHILVELYASGNVILTDHSYTILSLLRSHKFEENARIAVKQEYPFGHAANLTLDSIVTDKAEVLKLLQPVEEPVTEAAEKPEPAASSNKAGAKKGGKGGKDGGAQAHQPTPKQKKVEKATLKSMLTKIVPYASFPYADHALRETGVDDPNTKAEPTEEHVDALIAAANFLRDMVREMEDLEDIRGFITYVAETERPQIAKPAAEDADETQAQEDIDKLQEEAQQKVLTVDGEDIIEKFRGKVLREFLPCELLAANENDLTIDYYDFDQCVDEYFSQAEKHKEKSKIESKENAIWQKMNRIQEDQEKRIQGLQREQDLSDFKAQLLQKYVFEAQAIIDILSVMINSGIGWKDINRMVKEERKANNPFANLIYSISFEKNLVSLMLDAVDENDDLGFQVDDQYVDNFDQVMRVDIDLGISAQLNIKKYFEIRKKSYAKEVKTKDAANVAIKQAEKTAARDFEKLKQTQLRTVQRKIFWFEKFIWFITSENYLVIGGRNAQQNEALVKRYMDKTDLFMHSELHGAAVCIVKNPSGGPVPFLSLNEAATFEMCHSPCWENKVTAQVYWVQANQVSKTPPTGMFISTGSFIIRGKRNFLQPQKLELGFTLMFCVSEESLANHMGERQNREDQAELDQQADSLQRAESLMSNLTEEIADEPLNNESASVVDQILRSQKSLSTATKDAAFDESGEKITVVQVGEEARKYNPNKEPQRQNTKGDKKQQQQQNNQNQKGGKGGKKGKGANKKGEEEDYNKAVGQGEVKRGKHAKIRKMKEKYGDQDEEERQMRMALTGSKQVTGFDLTKHQQFKHGSLINAAQADEEEDEKLDVQEEDENQEAVADEVAADSLNNAQDADGLVEEGRDDAEGEADDATKEIAASDPDEEEKTEATAAAEAGAPDEDEEAELAKLIKEEDINLVPENTDVTEIDKLTGMPKQNDQLLFAIPMLAPYTTINTNKYKAKVTPGTLKRGRAQKSIRQLFLSQSSKTFVYETNLIKAVSDQDMTMTLVNSCRVMAPGLTKIQQQNRTDKKKGGRKD